jgi:hypothetical protein
MTLFNHRIAVLVGLGLLAAGCGAESFPDDTEDASLLTPQDGPTGHGGINGLLPSVFQPLRLPLEKLLRLPLTVNGVMNTDPKFGAFVSTPEGKLVFTYAVGCALPSGASVGDFYGEGLLTSTASWQVAPLTLQQQGDVQTCIMTRLNGYGVHVPIWLGGPDTGKDTPPDDYPYAEALWSARVNIDGLVGYSVWAADTFHLNTACGANTGAMAKDFNTRICENDPNLCHITLRTDQATACTGKPGTGEWVCDGRPAIETRLGLYEWGQIHPGCKIKKY